MKIQNKLGTLMPTFVLIMLMISIQPSPCNAYYIYTYTGNPFTEFENNNPNLPLYDSTNFITIEIKTSKLLTANPGVRQIPEGDDTLTISDGNQTVVTTVHEIPEATLTSGGWIVHAFFIDAVNADGIPTQWGIGATTPWNCSIGSTPERDWSDIWPMDIMSPPNHGWNVGTPGEWNLVQATPVPLPNTLILVSYGLAGLGVMRFKWPRS